MFMLNASTIAMMQDQKKSIANTAKAYLRFTLRGERVSDPLPFLPDFVNPGILHPNASEEDSDEDNSSVEDSDEDDASVDEANSSDPDFFDSDDEKQGVKAKREKALAIAKAAARAKVGTIQSLP